MRAKLFIGVVIVLNALVFFCAYYLKYVSIHELDRLRVSALPTAVGALLCSLLLSLAFFVSSIVKRNREEVNEIYQTVNLMVDDFLALARTIEGPSAVSLFEVESVKRIATVLDLMATVDLYLDSRLLKVLKDFHAQAFPEQNIDIKRIDGVVEIVIGGVVVSKSDLRKSIDFLLRKISNKIIAREKIKSILNIIQKGSIDDGTISECLNLLKNSEFYMVEDVCYDLETRLSLCLKKSDMLEEEILKIRRFNFSILKELKQYSKLNAIDEALLIPASLSVAQNNYTLGVDMSIFEGL